MNTTTERTAWTGRLAHVPTWALSEELQRRGEIPAVDQAVHLPGLTVDPVGSTVVWRGVEYPLCGRKMEVLYAIALWRAKGHRRMPSRTLSMAVFRSARRDDVQNARVHVRYLRQQFPGLLPPMGALGYELALDEPVAAQEVA
jgi:DNA-binding response OmpR family regulator